MVSDRFRTEVFAKAIAEAVQPGAQVLDVGTGTGILAMLAAKAGAAQVNAIDQSDISQTAANLVKANDLKDKVRVLAGPAADLQLDEKVDLLMSEWLGHIGFVENMLPDVLAARDQNLKPGGKMLPADVDVILAPLDDPILYGWEGPGYWREPAYGLDFSSLEKIELGQGRTSQIRIDPAGLLADGQSMVKLDLATCKPEEAWALGELRFTAKRHGVLNGFACWFRSKLSESVTLDTGPHEPETHWSQTYAAFDPQPVKAGDTFEVSFQLMQNEEEPRYVDMILGVSGAGLNPHRQRYTVE